jgi:hypothetical protein
MFPNDVGAPGDGNLVAVHSGGSTEVFGGLIHLAQVVETYPKAGVTIPTPSGRKLEPLTGDGVTVWIEGSLSVDIRGEPTVSDFLSVLERWAAVRDKLRTTDYELFLYYRTASPATYQKFKTVNTAILRSYWSNPVCLSFLLAAFTTDKTLYTTGPGS